MGIAAVPQISQCEARFVDVGADDTAFTCKTCNKAMSKRSALLHFTGAAHQLPRDIVKTWVVVSDANALRNKRPHKVTLGAALRQRESVDVPDSDEEVSAIAQSLPIPRSWKCPVKRRVTQKSMPDMHFVG